MAANVTNRKAPLQAEHVRERRHSMLARHGLAHVKRKSSDRPPSSREAEHGDEDEDRLTQLLIARHEVKQSRAMTRTAQKARDVSDLMALLKENVKTGHVVIVPTCVSPTPSPLGEVTVALECFDPTGSPALGSSSPTSPILNWVLSTLCRSTPTKGLIRRNEELSRGILSKETRGDQIRPHTRGARPSTASTVRSSVKKLPGWLHLWKKAHPTHDKRNKNATCRGDGG